MFQKVKISVEYLVVAPHYLVVPPRWSVRLTFLFRVRTDGPRAVSGLIIWSHPHFLRTLWFSLRTCDYPLFHWHLDSISQGGVSGESFLNGIPVCIKASEQANPLLRI